MPRGQPLRPRARPARTRARPARTLALLPAGVVLAACTPPVAVPAPTPPPEQVNACTAFTSALPDELSTVGPRREVDPESPLTAAYGDPPVGIRCGIPTPAALAPTSELVTVDGVDWFPEQLTGGWIMTTVGLRSEVEITVPEEQGPAPSVAADLSPTITATLLAG
jgi:hypothetical protein